MVDVDTVVLNSLVLSASALRVCAFSMVYHLSSDNLGNHNSASSGVLSNPAWTPAHDDWRGL